MKLEIDLDQLKNEIVREVIAGLKPLLSNKGSGRDGEVLLSVEGLAEYLGVEKKWVYAHIKEIPHSKVGKFHRFRKRDVDRWLEARRGPTMPDIPSVKAYKRHGRPLD